MTEISGNAIAHYLMAEKDADLFLGVSYKTLQTWHSRRLGPPYIRMARKCIRYRIADLQHYVDSRLVRA